ncbi:hypothetical protein ACRALDRAFT_2099699, partial [Sodiomyces alcalophilus JCM 7366]|uniref:uncharacterized protein n=1 Tax=Sodiomyces alcalophilus JCM 7366 TaxID=591952 RepID=UPI0039B64029
FRTRYSYFEYLVIPFRLINTLAILNRLVDTIYIVFLNDILIYSKDLKVYRVYIKEVLGRLRERVSFYLTPSKILIYSGI